MRRLDMEQRSPEWFAARLGIPTASRFKDILTSQGKKAAAFNRLADSLAGDILAGLAEETYQSDAMLRGIELEDEARKYYEFTRDAKADEVGFVLLDDGSAGASPDGLMDDRGLEIKCPLRHTHVAYLRAGKLPADYVPQVQGCMWICERDQWDFLSYHPDLPPLLITVERDDDYIKKLAALVVELNSRVRETVSLIQENYA